MTGAIGTSDFVDVEISSEFFGLSTDSRFSMVSRHFRSQTLIKFSVSDRFSDILLSLPNKFDHAARKRKAGKIRKKNNRLILALFIFVFYTTTCSSFYQLTSRKNAIEFGILD